MAAQGKHDFKGTRRAMALGSALLILSLGACGGSNDSAGLVEGNESDFDPTSVEVPEFAPKERPDTAFTNFAVSDEPSAPQLNLSAGPDVCFREIVKAFGDEIKVAEIVSFFSAGEVITGRSSPPRGEMTTCNVSFQDPANPRKLMSAQFNSRTGQFGEARPVDIQVMSDAASFRLADHVVPLSRVNAAALRAVMVGQDRQLRRVYGEYAWSGVRLEGPDAFSRTHTLRLDLDGRIATNDVKGSGYASVSIDGERITANHLMP